MRLTRVDTLRAVWLVCAAGVSAVPAKVGLRKGLSFGLPPSPPLEDDDDDELLDDEPPDDDELTARPASLQRRSSPVRRSLQTMAEGSGPVQEVVPAEAPRRSTPEGTPKTSMRRRRRFRGAFPHYAGTRRWMQPILRRICDGTFRSRTAAPAGGPFFAHTVG